MLEYDRIDISKEINVNKTSTSKECDICHYWYLKDIGFNYKPYLCNCCHDLMQKVMSFNDVAIVYVKGNAYRIHFWYLSKNDAILIWLMKRVFCNFLSLIYKKLMIWLIIKKQRCDTKKRLESIQYHACLALLGAVRGLSREKTLPWIRLGTPPMSTLVQETLLIL